MLVAWDRVPCRRPPGDPNGESDSIVNSIDPFDAEGSIVSGEIHATSSLVNEGLDGDHASHEVAVTAEPRSSSGLAGTIEVSRTYVNGQGEALDEDYEPSVCRSGSTSWTATLDPTADPGDLFAFRDTARGRTEHLENLAPGAASELRHPVRRTSLIENVDPRCVAEAAESELGWIIRDRRSTRPFPPENASTVVDVLRSEGVPVPLCAEPGG